MPIKKTERGFDVYDEFVDTYGNTIKVQESSSVDERVWVFLTASPDLMQRPGEVEMHLDVQGVDRLIAALQEWRSDKEA